MNLHRMHNNHSPSNRSTQMSKLNNRRDSDGTHYHKCDNKYCISSKSPSPAPSMCSYTSEKKLPHFSSARTNSANRLYQNQKRANSISSFQYENNYLDSNPYADYHYSESEQNSTSPFTYIETMSIQRNPPALLTRYAHATRYAGALSSRQSHSADIRSTRSTPSRSIRDRPSFKETHKTVLFLNAKDSSNNLRSSKNV